MTARLRRTLTVLLSVLLLAGCYSEEEIAATRDALDQLETDLLDDHPELTDVDADDSISTGVDLIDQISVTASADIDSTEHGRDLIETLTERTWNSTIPDISRLSVTVVENDTSERHTAGDVFGAMPLDDSELLDLLGPRDAD